MSLSLTVSCGLSGLASGSTADSLRRHAIGRTVSAAYTSTDTGTSLCNNGIDKSSAAQTLTAGGTLSIDLTNFVNTNGDTAQAMTIVRSVYVEHVSGSPASSIAAFGAAANSFQGPVSAGGNLTLKPGDVLPPFSQSTGGWPVDATHKTFQIVNNDGVNDATIRYAIHGSN